MPSVPVVAAVIERDGRYLICQRPAHKRHGGLWEFPGGKMHDGETIADAVRRELLEELHVEPSWVGDVRHAIRDPGSEFVIQFVNVVITGEPHSSEHDAIAWVEVASLTSYLLAPSDTAFAQHLARQDLWAGG